MNKNSIHIPIFGRYSNQLFKDQNKAPFSMVADKSFLRKLNKQEYKQVSSWLRFAKMEMWDELKNQDQ